MTVPTTNLALWLRADSNVATSGARQFNSADSDALYSSDNAALSTGDVDFTIAGWMYADVVATTQNVMGKWGPLGSSTNCEFLLELSASQLTFYIGNGVTINTVTRAAAISSSTWYFVVVEHNAAANTVTISVNDEAATSAATTISPADTTYGFALGRDGEFLPNTFGGRLSKWAMWKRTLTSAERTWLYNAGSGRLYGELGIAATDGSALLTSLSAYWNLNENAGADSAVDAHSTNDLTSTGDVAAAAGVGESTGVIDGDPVSRWTSKDVGAYEFAQSTASKRPLYKASAINSQPGILFDGVDDLLVCASAFLTGETGTVIIVFRLTAVPDAYQTILASSDEASDTRYVEFRARGNTANPHIMMEQRNADTADTLDGDTTVNVDTDYAMVFHGSGSEITAMLNDTAQTITADAGANTGDWWDDSTAKDNVTIGAVKRSSETRHLSAYVADVIVYSTVQGNAELADLDDYVFSTYGLSIGDYPTEETTVSIVGWSQAYRQNGTDLVEHTFEWLSDASGNATLPSWLAVSGQIERVVFIPSSSVAPTSLYDVTLTDEDGVDVLAGQGANLSATLKSSVKPGIPLKDGTTTSTVPTVVDGILTLNVSNAGDSKGGTVLVYVR